VNIALVILHADPARGGAERYTVDLAEALAKRGHRVTLLATSFPIEERASQVTRLNVQQHQLVSNGATRLSRYLRFLDSLDAHLAEHSYDIVHAMLPVRRCHVYHPHAGLAAESIQSGHLVKAGAVQQQMAKWANRLNRKRQAFATVERELLSSANPPVVLCLSDLVKLTVQRHFPNLDESHLATLFNATDLHRFDPTARPDAGVAIRRQFNISGESVVTLMLAQDFTRKGLSQTIHALAKTNDKRLVLLVAGREDPSSYRRLADSLGVADRVRFAGPTSDPYAFYKAADFFVLPTRHDPCSLVVLESLAMGVPVISTVFNGACEIMENGRHGIVLTDPGDVPALAAAMSTLLDANQRSAMATACLELRAKLSYDTHLNSLQAIYNSVSSANVR
jgi:UDP-glucose:(heptosyl)LPS alpha-1,3-glucosyltransferase